MVRSSGIIIWGTIFFLAVFKITLSQEYDYRFRHLTTGDGLPSNNCLQVMKDSRGFIWIVTRAGICRYDGYNVKVFRNDPADSASLSENRFYSSYCMAEDTNGFIWIGTYMNGLNRYDPATEKFKRYLHIPGDPGSLSNNAISCLYLDRKGTLWVATGWKGGLHRYDPRTDKFIAFNKKPGDSAWYLPTIHSMLEDHAGNFWVGTWKGLFLFNRQTGEYLPVPAGPGYTDPSDPPFCKILREDRDGTLFIGTQYGFLVYDRVNRQVVPYPPLYRENISVRFLDLLEDPSGKEYTHWIVKEFGLFRFNKHTHALSQVVSDPKDPASLSGNVIKTIYRDETGLIWLPSEFGVNILDHAQNRIEHHPEHAVKYNDAMTFFAGSTGLWAGSRTLVRYDEDLNVLEKYDLFSRDLQRNRFARNIWSLLEDSEKNLWIGTGETGLLLMEARSKRIVPCTLSPVESAIIYDIFEDSQGIIWVGGDHGLYQRRKEEMPLALFHRDTAWGLLNTAMILCIAEDRQETLWIGTAPYGLFCQPKEDRGSARFRRFVLEPDDTTSLSNNWVWSVYENPSGGLWIATENGLNQWNRETETFSRYSSRKIPGANFVYDLTGDHNGFLWLTTESGLIRFDPSAGPNGDRGSYSFEQILPFSDIFPYHIYQAGNGRVFVGGSYDSGKGFYCFYPDSLEENKQIPPVYMIGFRVNDSPFHLDSAMLLKKHIILRHDQNFLDFEFAALDYRDPLKNQYAYFLEGLDERWTYSGNNRIARYTRVPPGKYLFRVRGSNNDGYWNEAGTAVSITILPPPWKTWWAYTLYALGALTACFLVIRFYLTRLRLTHKLEMEQVETQKLKELDILRSRFFANISHEFRTPLTLILGPLERINGKVSDEIKHDIGIVLRNARRLQRLISQLLDISRLESAKMKLEARETDLVRLLNGYVQSFESYAKQRNIELVFNADATSLMVWIDPDKIEKILYNLLSNAFKFTPEGGRIKVEVRSQKSEVRSPQSAIGNFTISLFRYFAISISDTGPGIPHDKLAHIFDRFYQVDDSASRTHEGTGIGLALTKELVELHHGTITVESEVGKGTNFTVTLPFGKEHLKEEELAQGTGQRAQKSEGKDLISDIPHLTSLPKYSNQARYPQREGSKSASGDLGVEKPLLLLVEDNADLREYVRGGLGEFYQLLEAGDGEEGLKLAVETIPDLIITDVMMPKMDGYQLCQRLKTDERTSHIPVILLTARAGKESRIEGLETGADDFITKPFDMDEMIVRARNLISQRERIRERFIRKFRTLGMEPLFERVPDDLSSMDQQFLQKVTAYLIRNLSDDTLDVEALGNQTHLSSRQLHRKIVALTGESPNRFIRSVRLHKAAELLRKKTGTVTEIAYEVGFNNLSWFAKCFREEFGVLPSDYPNV